MPDEIDYANRQYPRWAHNPNVKLGLDSKIVNTPDEERAAMAEWAAQNAPKPEGNSLTAATQVAAAPPQPQPPSPFTVYDVNTDTDIPLTQNRLDELLTAETAMSILWAAILEDGKSKAAPFPPVTSMAIAKVIEDVLPAQDGTTDTPAKPRRGRPPKPKPEVTDGA